MPDWTATELAYLAGFIDGEGSICIFQFYKDKKRRSRTSSAARLSAYNSNRDVLEWIAFRFGGRVGLVKRRSVKNKAQFIWEQSGKKASVILKACLPYLKIKKQQAELFIEVANTMLYTGRTLPENVIDFRFDAAEKMAALNKKGATNAS